MATLEDLEARIAAMEASHADYRAVLAAVNALGANQREHAFSLSDIKADVSGLKADVSGIKADVSGLKPEFLGLRQEMRATSRSTDEQLAEIKDLIVGRAAR